MDTIYLCTLLAQDSQISKRKDGLYRFLGLNTNFRFGLVDWLDRINAACPAFVEIGFLQTSHNINVAIIVKSYLIYRILSLSIDIKI